MELTRRTFIKGVTATCAGAVLIPGSIAAAQKEGALPALKGSNKSIKTTCEMCSFRCPIKGSVTNGRLFLEGNENSKFQENHICAKGGSGFSLLYDPNRIIEPMKRIGKRGEGKWEKISWQQAYKEIGDKLNDLKAKNGPESVVFTAKSGSLFNHFAHFCKSFGSPNIFSHFTTCPGARSVAGAIMLGGDLTWDLENTKYVIFFGHNLYEGIEVADTAKMAKVQANGGKIVSFDPRMSIASSKADEYFYIKPGTDTAVILAMCNYIIQNQLYDKQFIEKFTIDMDKFANNIKDITLEKAEAISGIKAEDIKRITEELVGAAPCCIVSPGHRSTFSYDALDMRRGLFSLNFLLGNIERKGGMYLSKSVKVYNEVAGEKVASPLDPIKFNYPKPNKIRIDLEDHSLKYAAARGGVYQKIFETAITDKPYPIKGWVMTRTNPLQTITDLPKILKAIDKLELIVSCDVYMTDTAAYADYFLPECTYLERYEDIEDRSSLTPAFALRQPVIKNIIGNSKPSTLIWQELARYMGLAQYYTWGDMPNRQLLQLGGDENFYKKLLDEGFVSFGKAPLMYREPGMVNDFVKQYPKAANKVGSDGTLSGLLKFNTPSGRIEFFSDELEKIAPGYGAPKLRDIPLKKDDELFYIQGKVAVHTNGATVYVPNLIRLMNNNPIWINPETADKFGLKEGDKVYLENNVGKEKGTVMITKGIRPDTIFTYMAGFGVKKGWSTKEGKEGIYCNNLLPYAVAKITGTCVHTFGIKISKA